MKRVAIITILLIWYSIVGHLRVNDWTSELSLWTRAVKISPHKARTHLNLAKALFGAGREDDSEAEIKIFYSLQ
jgi:hypothetical protein